MIMSGIANLTAYSMLAQAGIGLAVMLYIGNKVCKLDGAEETFYRNGFFLAALLTAMAMLVSLTHLGSPLRAPNAILHLGSSWLSREIFCNGLFFACIGVTFLLAWKKRAFGWCALASVLTGLACVFCQASIYAHAVMPAWEYGNAYVSFFAAAFSTGAVIAGLILLRRGEAAERGRTFLFVITGVLFLSIALQIGWYAVLAGKLETAGAAGLSSLSLLAQKDTWVMLSLFCLLLGFIGCLSQIYQKQTNPAWVSYMTAIFVIAGEVIGRAVFYGIGAPIGL